MDIDISQRLKMIGEIFYDPNYMELWQQLEYDNNDYDCWNDDCLENEPMKDPANSPIHLDFGFIFAVNESFRFGVHFQKPFIAFYWKI